MGWTDWLISIALILLVVRQVRGKKLGMVGLLWPVAAVVAAAVKFLGAVPAQLSDLLLVAVLGVVGLGLGLG
ncbi:MAG: hypothetical protein ACRDQ1_09775, partial [Sciscionella sp.]